MKYLLEKTHLKLYQIIIIILFFILMGVLSARLFYNQAIGVFLSDLNMHISEAINKPNESYSLISIIYRLLYYHLGGCISIAIFLAVIFIITIVATKMVLTYLIKPKENHFILWIYAIVLNFVTPILIPFINEGQWLVGYQSASIWHNSTYQFMKLFAILSILMFFKIRENYIEHIKIHEYIIFTILLSITNAIKPNFILAFAPTLAIFLAFDFFRNLKNKKAIIHIFIFGFAILISLIVLIFQASILYGKNSTDNSSIEFGFMTVLSHFNEYPILSIIQSAAFPLFIFITNFKTIIKNKNYIFSYVTYLIGLLIYLFINETGGRKYHGNFEWTANIALMIAFICSIAILDNSRFEEKKYKKIYLISSYSILLLHFIFGGLYFLRLSRGINFF